MRLPGGEAIRGSWGLYRRLLDYVLPHWPRLLGSLMAMALVAGTTASVAYLLKPVIDRIFIEKERAFLVLLPLGVLALYLVKGLANYAQIYLLRWVGQRAMRELRDDLFGRLLRLPLSFFSEHSAGSLISRLTYDVDQVQAAVTNGFSILLKDSLTALCLLAVLFYHDWPMALAAVVVLPLVVGPLARLTRKLRQSSRSSQQLRAAMTHIIEESVLSNRVIKAFNGEPWEQDRFHREVESHRQQNMRQVQAMALSTPLMEFLGAVGIALVIYYGGHRVMSPHDPTTPGTFFSFLTAMLMMYEPLKRLTRINAVLQQGLAAGERIFSLLDQEPEPDPGTRIVRRAQGELRFEGVEFGYEPNRAVLREIDLEVPAGHTLALVGQSGAGKSTLVSLVPRLCRPRAGCIRLDGIDIAELTLGSLRRQIALVSQEIALFHNTLAHNIAYGKPNASREAIEDAARAAGVTEFLKDLEGGLDHDIGERGTRLSEGQRQRIAIARALLRDAPILILDEATSSLDPHSERLVQNGLDRLMCGRTTLVIAHRLSTVQQADAIAVMESGHITEYGRHEELLARSGTYAQLWATQFAPTRATQTGAV